MKRYLPLLLLCLMAQPASAGPEFYLSDEVFDLLRGYSVPILMLALSGVPLIFGLQRFGLFKRPLWKVLLTWMLIWPGTFLLSVATLITLWEIDDNPAYYIGYFAALPLLVIGLIVLVASFLSKKRRGPAAGSVAETPPDRSA